MRAALLGVLLLTLAACSARTNAPSVQVPDALTAGEAWTEVPIRWRFTVGIPRYRSGDFDMTNVERTHRRQITDSKNLFRTRVEYFDSTSFTFAVQEKSGLRSLVTAHFAHTSDMEHPTVFGRRVEGDRDVVLEETYSSRFDIVVDGDTAGRWTVEVVSRAGPRVPDSLSYSAHLASNGRAVRVGFLTPGGLVFSAPVAQFALSPGARGFVLREGDRALAAVQYIGGGMFGGNDIRAWLPEALERRDRLERMTLMMVMLISGSRNFLTREHRVGN